MTIGEKISIIRFKRGLTLNALSEKTNFSIGQLSNLENGYLTPSDAMLDILCEGLSLSREELLNDRLFLARRTATQVPVFASLRDASLPISRAKITGNVFVSNLLLEDGSFFITVVEDNLMTKVGLHKGDHVLVHRQSHVENNEVAIVQTATEVLLRTVVCRGDEAVLYTKKCRELDDSLLLTAYDYYKILGKVVRIITDIEAAMHWSLVMHDGDIVPSAHLSEYLALFTSPQEMP